MGSPKTPGIRLSGGELRRLLELREMIKVEALRLPAPLQRRVLELLESMRPWTNAPPALPEMSRGELVRAIRWRLGTVDLAAAESAAEFIRRHRRKAKGRR